MTLEELSQSLPNGFHDALLTSLSFDLVHRVVQLDLELWVPESDVDHIETYRRARVDLVGVECLAIDPPQADYPFSEVGTVRIDDGPGDVATASPRLPKTSAAHHWFFVSNWNAFVHVAAREAKLEWMGDRYVRDHGRAP